MNTWIKGLVVFLLSAAVTTLATTQISPSTFNFTGAGLRNLLLAVAIFGAKTVLAYIKQSPLPNFGSLKVLILIPFLAVAISAHAQAPAPTPALVQNIYAGGASYNPGGSPTVAGTAMYAHLISADTGTYGFTVFDAFPVSVKPFTVNTNVGAGIAQKVFTLGNIPIFIPTSAGISFNGQNTGWAWSTGAMASIRVKGNWRILPNVRWQKSSVSNGAGYQIIGGILIGFGN